MQNLAEWYECILTRHHQNRTLDGRQKSDLFTMLQQRSEQAFGSSKVHTQFMLMSVTGHDATH